MQVSTAEFKKGLRIVYDGAPYQIVDFQHVKPGKGGAFVRTKLKHMRQGKVIDKSICDQCRTALAQMNEAHGADDCKTMTMHTDEELAELAILAAQRKPLPHRAPVPSPSKAKGGKKG